MALRRSHEAAWLALLGLIMPSDCRSGSLSRSRSSSERRDDSGSDGSLNDGWIINIVWL